METIKIVYVVVQDVLDNLYAPVIGVYSSIEKAQEVIDRLKLEKMKLVISQERLDDFSMFDPIRK